MKQERLLVLLFAGLALACAAAETRFPLYPLDRTHWTLTELGSAGGPLATTQTEPYLTFGDPPGRVSGSGGCNRLAGSYEQKGGQLTLGPIASTRMACPHGMQVEDALAIALSSTRAFRIVSDRLELRDATGVLLATFTARTAN